MQDDIRMNTDVYVFLDQLVIQGCMYLYRILHPLIKQNDLFPFSYVYTRS